MANAVFSPRDFKAWIIEEATPGTAPTITSGLYQLDVDSVAFPSLNPNQVLDVRSRTGRVLHKSDFFQDNEMRAVELSLSGTYHNDGGLSLLLNNVCANTMNAATIADASVAAAATGVSGKYGTSQADATFTLVLAPPDTDDGYNTLLTGCQCTSFSISADSGTEGGLYKWSANISTGFNPTTNNATAEAGTAYGAGLISLSGLGTKTVGAATVILSSFDVTVESPAVYSGVSSNGYEAFSRGSEISITANATVKYDSATRGLFHTFNTQTAATEGSMLVLTQGTATNCSISMPDAVFTDVVFNEGDVMMLDVSMKAVSDGSSALITFDLA